MGTVTGAEQSVLAAAAERAIKDAQAIAIFALPEARLDRVGLPITWLGDLVDRLDNGKELPPRRRILGLSAWILTLVPDVVDDPQALEHIRMSLTYTDWARVTKTGFLRELAMEGILLLHEQGTRPGSQVSPPQWCREVFSIGVCLAVAHELSKKQD